MAEILGLGVTHWPTLCLPNEGLTGVFKRDARRPQCRSGAQGSGQLAGRAARRARQRRRPSAANRCGERFGNDFRAIRKILDDFNPDFVLVWGDDQYENFKEDIVPAFCLARL